MSTHNCIGYIMQITGNSMVVEFMFNGKFKLLTCSNPNSYTELNDLRKELKLIVGEEAGHLRILSFEEA